jgi:hypothetical protein
MSYEQALAALSMITPLIHVLCPVKSNLERSFYLTMLSVAKYPIAD